MNWCVAWLVSVAMCGVIVEAEFGLRGAPTAGMTADAVMPRLSRVSRLSGMSADEPRVRVESPARGSDVAGKTTLKVRAAGADRVDVKCRRGFGTEGGDVSLGSIKLDKDGRGSIEIDAETFSHGPMTVRFRAVVDGNPVNSYLQLYNTGGVGRPQPGADAERPREPGEAATGSGAKEISTPAGAKGLKLVFVDEFDAPLSISRDGAGARYCSHKPGGGDFSGIPFGDHENAASSPFLQRDTYLRIRADEEHATTGLVSSLRMDGTGFTASAPCYFECRFVAPSAPGTWPAFWLMTTDVHKGMKEPADELDVIEAYGGEGQGQPNQRGYWINSHYWNQGPDGGKDLTQPGFAGMIDMCSLKGTDGSSWFETVHTYGVLVGESDTVYFCDGVEAARHPTSKLARTRPLFFMINLAVGGTSGWARDLSGVGGVADMYIDYVRVYAARANPERAD